MADEITLKALQDASVDAKSLEEVVNGNEAKQVTTRLGESYPSVKKAIKTLFENGGLPATPFATKALMTSSALVDGDYAMVTDGGVDNGLHLKTDGVWVKSAYDPELLASIYTDNKVAAELDFKTTVTSDDIAFAINDSAGKTAVTVSKDATLNTVATTVGGNRVSNDADMDAALAIRDSIGNHSFIANDDGSISIDSLKVRLINGIANSEGGDTPIIEPKKDKPVGFTAEINGVCSYGQSLAMGSTSTPVVSTTQKYDNLMFNSGVRFYDAGTDPAVIYASLVPMVEAQLAANGETPVSGMADNIKELILSENGLAYTAMSYKVLGAAPAEGGKNISSLLKGSPYYARMIDNIKYGALRAADGGYSYAYQATTWLQGEADYSASTPKAIYKTILNDLVNDIKNDAIDETKQSFEPEFIIGQVGSHLRYAQSQSIPSAFKADIAQGQLELSIERDDVHLACPSYQFDYSGYGVDQVHLTATDERVMGAYFGLVYKRVVIDGEKWQPLKPIAVTKSKNSVYITLNNKSDLVIDTTWVYANKDYGFRVFDGTTQVAITSVEIVNSNSIKLLLETALTGVMTVDYALKSDHATGETGRKIGARGNIRDSQGDTIIFDATGVNRPLHNWLVMFTYTDGESSWL